MSSLFVSLKEDIQIHDTQVPIQCQLSKSEFFPFLKDQHRYHSPRSSTTCEQGEARQGVACHQFFTPASYNLRGARLFVLFVCFRFCAFVCFCFVVAGQQYFTPASYSPTRMRLFVFLFVFAFVRLLVCFCFVVVGNQNFTPASYNLTRDYDD